MRNELFYIVLTFIVFNVVGYAQVGIGTNSPDASASLQIFSTNRGFLPPVMTQVQRDAIVNPAEGLMLYCSDCFLEGYFVFKNGNWHSFSIGDDLGNHKATQDIDLGNYHLTGGGADGLTINQNGEVRLSTGMGIKEFSDDPLLADNSNTAVPTEAAVKLYVDSRPDNDNQNISRSGLTVTLQNGGSFQDSVLTEAAVDAMVANNGYLTSFTEVDGSITNEIQDLSLSGNTLSLTGDATTVDLSTFLNADNLGNHTATQNIDLGSSKLVGNGGSNGVTIANDGKISLTSGASVNEFSEDGTLTGNSNFAVPTERAIKTYVDSNAVKLIKSPWGLNNYHANLSNMGNIGNNATDNYGLGLFALNKINDAHSNIAIGFQGQFELTTGNHNTAIGHRSLLNNQTGEFNTALGYRTGLNVTGTGNTLIGTQAGGIYNR